MKDARETIGQLGDKVTKAGQIDGPEDYYFHNKCRAGVGSRGAEIHQFF